MAIEASAAPADLVEARSQLADEWRARNPQTPDEITQFYTDPRVGAYMRADLNAWHDTAARQSITEILKVVARATNAKHVVDIGAGAGHDLRALAGIVPFRHGIEPNDALRADLEVQGFQMHRSVEHAQDCCVTADLFVSIDVLEHLPDPESFLDKALGQAKIGAHLFEMTATHDTGTPLHLKSNRGWRPGRWLEQHGWWEVDNADRIHIWQKQHETGIQSATLLAAVSRMPTIVWTANRTTGAGGNEWRMRANVGDALLTRSRSILAYNWWIDTGDDVFLMIDDDIDFSKQDADRAIAYCRDGYDIVCGGYPVRDASHLALRWLPSTTGQIHFGPPGIDEDGIQHTQEPIEIMYAATGFMAVHRRVLDGMAKSLPLVNSGAPWYVPFFQELFRYDEQIDGILELSEDWGFCALARDAGFKVWVDPQAILSHEGRTVPLTVKNMKEISYALTKA